METKLTLRDKTVIIGPTRAFVMIGERINPTRRKKLAASIVDGDFLLVQEDARVQVMAGAQVLDVNAGIPGADEPALLRSVAQAVMDVVNVPLCFDSASPEALAAALDVYPGQALINSTTAEESMLEKVMPLASQYGAAVIGVISDEKGIPSTPEDRLRVAEKLIKRAGDYGVPAENIIIDPLALTVSADHKQALITLDSIDLIRQELGVNMNLGASNVSFGLPDRKIINVAYLAMAISRGLTVAITDPTVPEIQTTLLACDLLMGRDEFSSRWIKAFRAREKAKAAVA